MKNAIYNIGQTPGVVGRKASTWNQNNTLLTSFNTGDVIPIYVNEVLPGDIFKMNESLVIRSTTPLAPVMDNSYLDTAYFFVPNRLLWENWEEFMGANKTDEWDEKRTHTVPQLEIPAGGFTTGTIAEKMGIPVKQGAGTTINHLPFRAYVKIWNDWYRDQNTQKPALNVTTSAKTTGEGGINTDPIQTAIKGGQPLPANKYKDYFTSALPSPQKGNQVLLSLLGQAPVVTSTQEYDLSPDAPQMVWNDIKTGRAVVGDSGESVPESGLGYGRKPDGKSITFVKQSGTLVEIAPRNLFADMSKVSASSINDFRKSMALQQVLELNARAGTRYNEKLLAFFGVHGGDARLDRAEYLGGKNLPIEQNQVAQTAPGTTDNPLGDVAAYTLTADTGGAIDKAFTEHGYVIGVAMVRTNHSYQQGVEKMWLRETYTDFYNPLFANLGEQPILNKEIYLQNAPGNPGDKDINDAVFGYQEAWGDYRYKKSIITGQMNSKAAAPLDIWHYGDKYDALPTLSSDFIKETKDNVDRTLAVKSTKADQWILNMYFANTITREMPVHTNPGGLERLF